MKVTADTNVLVRAITEDDERQSEIAKRHLAGAEQIAVTLPALCELAWVLLQGYRFPARDVAEAIRRVVDSDNVIVNRPAAEAGLALLEAGGDFADGVIAFEGRWLGGTTFMSFDRNAVRLVRAAGSSALLLT